MRTTTVRRVYDKIMPPSLQANAINLRVVVSTARIDRKTYLLAITGSLLRSRIASELYRYAFYRVSVQTSRSMLENRSVDAETRLDPTFALFPVGAGAAFGLMHSLVGVRRTQRFAFPNTFACRRYRHKKCDLLRSESKRL